MNSTLKSLLFWMVLVVIAALIWNFSTNFQRNTDEITFTDFLQKVNSNQISMVTFTGTEITGSTSDPGGKDFRTYMPPQGVYDGLANQLESKGVVIEAHPESTSRLGHAAHLVGPDRPDGRVLGLHHAADAERREQGPVVRQEPRQAVLVARRRR